MRNITALLIALLLATACSSAPGAGSALSGQLPPPTTTTTPTNPQLTYADMSPKCAEALEAASLLKPVPPIGYEVPPEYGPGSVDWLADTDGDGFIKSVERLLGTNPQNPDTDGDGFSDGEECTELDSDPLEPDGPSLPTTTLEDTPVEDMGWRPGSDDSLTTTSAVPTTSAAPWISCGGAKQAWLAENEGMAWVTPNALTDDDGDGIQYSDERYYGTDPDNPDTDGDGVWDGDECRFNTNPLDADDPPMTCCARPAMTTDSASGLRSPDYEYYQPRAEADAGEPRGEPVPVNTDVLIGLPWRDAQQMAHDAGWATQMIFIGEDGSSDMTEEFVFARLRIFVDGGEEAGTVKNVFNS